MQVTKEMIEAGARAICARIGLDPDAVFSDDKKCNTNWHVYTVEAKAAINAALSEMWQPIETAPKDTTLLGVVDGEVRLIRWTKTSHVPLYGWCLVDQGAEDCDFCKPTQWMPLPPTPETK